MASKFILPAALLLSSLFLSAQQKQPPAPQTAHQAMIEMLTGGEKAIEKHLTLEIQQMIADESKKKGPRREATGIGFDGGGMLGVSLAGLPLLGKDLQTFDTGPALLTYNDRREKQKVEVRVEGDDLRGDEDEVQLSFHVFQDGQEQSIPYMPSLTVTMKQQEGIWRLNQIGGSVKLAVGDRKFFEDLRKSQEPAKLTATASTANTSKEKERSFQSSPFMAVRMLAFAESSYAQQHPDTGFTCNLADLINDKDAPTSYAGFLDPQIATGTANGYRYSISGCEGNPAEVFHIVAEPLAPGNGAKAYCTNTTNILRTAEDGRGSTCLTAGKVAQWGEEMKGSHEGRA